MKLLKLTITNFKCLRSLVLQANGQNLDIYAENGIGKTTVADAYYWLLFGKDSLGRKDFEIKPIGSDGEPVHFLETSVLGEFFMADGETLALERIYKEDWQTQRGSSTKSFKGHTTDYKVNTVPQSATEYQKRIASICDEDQFRLLTGPARFLALTWQERRRMLFDITGDMTDQEVIDATEELGALSALMGKLTLAEFKRKTEAERTATNDERKNIPARIDEATRAIPAEDSTDWDAILARRNKALADLHDERSKLNAGGKAAELRSKIVDIDAERKKIETELSSQPNPEREKAIADRRSKTEEATKASESAVDLNLKISGAEARLKTLASTIETKRESVRELKAKAYTGSSECPACKRALPEDQIQSAVEAFNLEKSSKLTTMIAEGKALVEEQEKLDAWIKPALENLAALEATIKTLQSERDAIVIPEVSVIDPNTNETYVQLGKQKEAVQAELTKLNEDAQSAIDNLNDKLAKASEAVQEAQRGIAAARQRKDGLKRVEELKAREKELGAIYESLERSLFLCEQFYRSKVRLLTERINERFERTTFRLFREQINGGLQEVCDVLWRENEALPSNGQAVQIGLDIINVLSENVGFAPPIFIDNAESITGLIPTNGQQIRLIVSEGDKELRVVTAGTSETKELQMSLL